MPEFPWADLKAETLRAICKDLGAPYTRKRDDMITFFQTVQDTSLEAGLEAIKEPRSTPSVTSSPAAPSRKRKAVKEDSASVRITRSTVVGPVSQNTRSAGVKRPKVSANTSTAKPKSRATAARSRTRRASSEKEDDEAESISTPIGKRTTKSTAKSSQASKKDTQSSKPVSQKAVFDGVLLPVPLRSKAPSNELNGERNGEKLAEAERTEVDPLNLESQTSQHTPENVDFSEPTPTATSSTANDTQGDQEIRMNGHPSANADHNADQDGEGSVDMNVAPVHTVSEPPTTRGHSENSFQLEDADAATSTVETSVIVTEVTEPVDGQGPDVVQTTVEETITEETTTETMKDVDMEDAQAMTIETEVTTTTTTEITNSAPQEELED